MVPVSSHHSWYEIPRLVRQSPRKSLKEERRKLKRVTVKTKTTGEIAEIAIWISMVEMVMRKTKVLLENAVMMIVITILRGQGKIEIVIEMMTMTNHGRGVVVVGAGVRRGDTEMMIDMTRVLHAEIGTGVVIETSIVTGIEIEVEKGDTNLMRGNVGIETDRKYEYKSLNITKHCVLRVETVTQISL